MEVAVAFAAGTFVGAVVARRRATASAAAPDAGAPPAPPLPPPSPPRGRILSHAASLDLEGTVSADGEDLRTREGPRTPRGAQGREAGPLAAVTKKDIAQVMLRKAPRPLTVDEKRLAFFHKVPLHEDICRGVRLAHRQ
eukprot:m51a1_g2809 hypothetical protein (139) ;mRNA; f:127302-127718